MLLYTKNNSQKRNKENNPIHNTNKNNKVFRNKFKQKSERSVLKTIRLWWKNLKKTQTNGKICHTDGSEELILLKRPYYSKPSLSNEIPIKISIAFFKEVEKKFYCLYGTTKDPIYPKQSWEKRTKLETSVSDVKLFGKATVIKRETYWGKK